MINPNSFEAFNNWIITLMNLASIKTGDEAESLYYQALDKCHKALETNPNSHQIFYNWGNLLVNIAANKTEADDLYNQAFEKFHMVIEYGGRSYNLACLYAIRGERESALKYLRQSLANNNIEWSFVLDDSDWIEYLNDPEFIRLIDLFKNSSAK